jgi:hypothetical protein
MEERKGPRRCFDSPPLETSAPANFKGAAAPSHWISYPLETGGGTRVAIADQLVRAGQGQLFSSLVSTPYGRRRQPSQPAAGRRSKRQVWRLQWGRQERTNRSRRDSFPRLSSKESRAPRGSVTQAAGYTAASAVNDMEHTAAYNREHPGQTDYFDTPAGGQQTASTFDIDPQQCGRTSRRG